MKTTRAQNNSNVLIKILIILLPSFILTITAVLYVYFSMAALTISPEKLIRPLLTLWIILLLLLWPIQKITKNWHWTGITLFVFVTAFYLAERLFYQVSILVLITLAVWVLISRLRRKRLKIEAATFFLSVCATSLLFILLTSGLPAFLSVSWQMYQSRLSKLQNSPPTPGNLPENKPDIYYIILDGYARSDILHEYYQFDNSEFIQYLTQKGFVVPSKIHSNYAKTSVSIPSTLNLDYIQNVVPGIEDSYFWWLMNPLVRKSRVQLFLKKAGYQSIAIATEWDITNNTDADTYFNSHFFSLSGFENALVTNTPLRIFQPLLSAITLIPSHESHRELIQYNLKTLAKIPQIPGPKYVFAHIIAPHPPFVLDENGNQIAPKYGFSFIDANDFRGTPEEYRTGYIGQLKFINRELQKTIDNILAQSKTPPIIILQADHGPGMFTDFRSSDNTCLKERFSPFGAYYLPGLKENPIPEDVTPVNLFRIVFNEYFSTSLPLLKNYSYYYKDTVYIFRYEDISAQLDNQNEKNCNP